MTQLRLKDIREKLKKTQEELSEYYLKKKVLEFREVP